jgi:hypothetical protein
MVKKATGADHRKEIVARALIDPAFRKVLFDNPDKIFGRPLSPEDAKGLEQIKKLVPHLGDIVGSMSSDILCTGGGGCGSSVAV